MFEHVVHVQHAQTIDTCIKIVQVQRFFFTFIAILLYFCYFNIIYYLIRVWEYGLHECCLHPSLGQWLGQCRPVPDGAYEGKFPPPIYTKLQILGNVLLAHK